jgi:Cys-tRNA(Pro)/Cys-tRNA(Cys) deacylase
VAKTVGTPALTALVRAKVTHTVHSYDHDARTSADVGFGMEAARALGFDPARVFKTLLADLDGGRLAVAIVPADSRLDLKAFAAALGAKKATMADPAAAERATGYVVGGISPLGQKRRLPTVLDSGAVAHPTVLVSAGRRGVDVELAPNDLIRLTQAVVADVARR